MKFGKRMRSLASKEWADHYVDYKLLKKQIKRLTDDQNLTMQATSDRFHALVTAEMNKVNKAHAFIFQQIDEQELRVLRHSLGSKWVLSPAKARSLLLDAIEISTKIDAFRRFVVLNSLAIVKITKKFDKATSSGLQERVFEELPRQPFYAGECMDRLCTDAIALIDRIMLCVLPDGNFRMNESSLSCPICLDSAVKSPISLSCGHIFCWSCLSKAAEHQFHSCPLCRKEQSIDPRDYEIDGLLKRFKRAYAFVENGLDERALASSPMRPILVEAFELLNEYIAEVQAQYSNLTPRRNAGASAATYSISPLKPAAESCKLMHQDQASAVAVAISPVRLFAKGDAVEVLYSGHWFPGMVLDCNDSDGNGTYSVLWWVHNNSQRFGQKTPRHQLREPQQQQEQSYMLYDIAAGAWETATQWALSPLKRLNSLSSVGGRRGSCSSSSSSSSSSS